MGEDKIYSSISIWYVHIYLLLTVHFDCLLHERLETQTHHDAKRFLCEANDERLSFKEEKYSDIVEWNFVLFLNLWCGFRHKAHVSRLQRLQHKHTLTKKDGPDLSSRMHLLWSWGGDEKPDLLHVWVEVVSMDIKSNSIPAENSMSKTEALERQREARF